MIAQNIFSWARRKPDHPFLIEENVSTSYAVVARMIEAVRHSLARESPPIGPSAHVLGGTRLEEWVIALALRALGIDTISITSPEMTSGISLPSVTLVVPARRVRPFATNAEALRHVRVVTVADEALTPALSGPLPEPGEKQGGYVVATSGTTGRYKRIHFEGPREQECLRWFASALAFDETTVFHGHNFPLWSGVGARLVPAVWYAGGTVVVTTTQDFKAFFAHRPSRAILVPIMVANLAAEIGDTGAPLYSGFELDVVGGFLPLALAERVARNITPHINVLYGSTEPAAHMRQRFVTTDDLHWLTELNTTYEIVDDAGVLVAAGTEGHLRVKLRPFDPQGYLEDKTATARFFRDGYFYPGDLAIRRDDGRIRVLGRNDDVINVLGYKIPIGPVEDRILGLLGADTVCVFSEMDNEGESRVVVAIESGRTFTNAELVASVEGRTGFKNARFVVLKEFPRTEMGMRKVNRRELRKLLT